MDDWPSAGLENKMVDTTPRVVQQPRNSTKVEDQYIGPAGQITVDSDRWEIRLHNGKKPGGWRIPNMSQLAQLFMTNKSEFGQTEFVDSGLGFLTRVGNKAYQLRKFLVGDGLIISTNDGSTGDPTLTLPDRLKEHQTLVTSIDDQLKTGFYVVQKGTTNLPAGLKDAENCDMIVIGYDDTVAPLAFTTQIVLGAQQAGGDMYIRRRVLAVWSSWLQVTGTGGTQTIITQGADETKRLWSANDLDRAIRSVVQSIQYIDAANAAKAFSINELFRLAGTGTTVSTQVVGAFNVATNDRFEIYASASALEGTSQNAKIEVEVAGVYQQVASLAVNSVAGDGGQTGTVVGRVIKTAAGYDVVDANWATQSSFAGAGSGNFRVTVGAAGKAGAHGTRWR